MDNVFPYTDTQRMLRDSLERFLAERYDIESRSSALETAENVAPLWRAFASDLGILGAAFSEDEGGLGGGFEDHLVILEVLGRHLAAEPYLSAMVHAGGLLRRCESDTARQLLRSLIDGEALATVAATEPHARYDVHDVRSRLTATAGGWRLDGRKSMVHCAPWATDLIVIARSAGAPNDRDGLSLIRLPLQTPGLMRRDYRTVDGGRASELKFDAVVIGSEQLLTAPGTAVSMIEQAHDEATLAMGAESIGVMSRLLSDTVAYAKERRQFGVPIASFQVLQHRLAEMYMALEQAKSLVSESAESIHASPGQRARAVSSAHVAVANACRRVGQGAVQIHGGMGMTEELAIGHFFRRATQIERRFGSSDHHLRRVAAMLDEPITH